MKLVLTFSAWLAFNSGIGMPINRADYRPLVVKEVASPNEAIDASIGDAYRRANVGAGIWNDSIDASMGAK